MWSSRIIRLKEHAVEARASRDPRSLDGLISGFEWQLDFDSENICPSTPFPRSDVISTPPRNDLF